jgi:hypothetical protein
MPINTKQMGLAMNAWQAMTPEQQTSFKPQMRQMMDEYRTRQQEAWSRARSYYTAADHGLGKERFDELTGKLANTTDPEKSRQSLFNDELVSLYSGIPANMLENKRGGYMQAIAEKELGHQGPIDDAAFFSGMQGLYKMEDEMQAKVLEGTVAGQSAGAIWQGLSQANAGKPGWKQKERDYAKRVYLQAHELKTMADRLRPTAERLAVLLSTAHTPAEVSPELRAMRGMSDKELAMVYELVASQSKPAEGAAAELGQAYHDAGIDLFHQVNRNAHLKSLDDAMAILDTDTKRGIRVPEGLKNTGEIVSYLATQGSYDRPLPESMGGDRQAGEGMRLLSSDEIAQVKTEAQEMRGDLATLGKFEKFADEKRNPTSDNGFFMRYFALPAARSLPITLSAAAGGLGLVAATRYYEQEETDRLVSLGVPYDKAKGNALAVGISQAIAERFQARFLLGKMPGTKKALDAWMKPGGNMALRGAGYLGANVAGETSIELLQDFIIPAAVQDITQVGGDVTWLGPDGVVQTALNAAPETAAGVFLFSLMGSGMATLSDIKGSEQMVKDRNLLLQTGYSEEQASEIAAIQDPKAALARAGELWNKRSGTKETMTKAANAVRQQVQQSRDSEQELEQLGLLPIMGRDPQTGDWYVRGKDGAAMPFGSYEEANAARWQEVESRKVGMHQAIRETLEMDERKLQPGEETKQQFSFREITQEQQVAAAPGDAQTLERRRQQSDVLDDGYEMEAYRAANAVNNATAPDAAAQEATSLVIGRSYTEFADGIRRRVMELNQGATPLTVVEESVEDDARKLLTSGKRDWLLANLRELEAKIGKLFVTTNDAEIETSDIVEAYSHVAVSYFAMKSRKGEGKFKNNKGWLDEFRAELRTMGIKRLLDATATKLYAMFRRAAKLGRLSQKGQINPEFEAQLAQSLGLEQALHEAGVAKEAAEQAKEMMERLAASGMELDAGNAAFSIQSGSLIAGALDQRLAKMFDPFQKSPELRQRVGLLAQQRTAKFAREWESASQQDRRIKDIDEEKRAKQDQLFVEKMQAAGVVPELSSVKDHPLLEKVWGRAMPFKDAKGRGIANEYDDAPPLPRDFYKGSRAPDQLAQELYDGGLLPDAFPATMWKAIEQAYAAVSRNAAGVKKAAQDARTESKEWAESEKKRTGAPKVGRARLLAALRTLDAILSTLPAELRGKIGGYIQLAKFTTDEARLKEIERRVERMDRELEKWLRKDITEQIEDLFDKARPKKDKAGKTPKGKLGPDGHHIFQQAEIAAKADAVTVQAMVTALDVRLADPNITPEQEVLLEREREIVSLVGDMKNATAANLAAAHAALSDLFQESWTKWKVQQLAKKEKRQQDRANLQADTGKDGARAERTERRKEMAGLFGKIKGFGLDLSSFVEVLRVAFGKDSAVANRLADAERNASNQYEDAIQTTAEEAQDLFTQLAGGNVLKGEQLRFDLSRPDITLGKDKFSQLEAITALLMWRQEDGRRHMEGQMDENGQPVSKWHYTQADMDTLDAALTPEARQVMAWLMQKYSGEYATLNPLYRARHGVDLPQNANYSPITVKPMQTQAGEVVDPVSGVAVAAGAIFTPGSLRTRSRVAVAEPDFKDALQVFLAHNKQMEWWKAYYDVAVDMRAIMGNREVMNSVEAAIGEEGSRVLGKWLDVFAQGGTRDAAAGLLATGVAKRMASRAATVALLGRVSTLLVQSTQLAAASVKMPVGAYLSRFGKLMAGQLSWGDAIKSDFIQRRIQTAPPIARQAMESLGEATRPNQISRAVRFLGNLLSGADGLFTGGTYAILLDYHREMGAKMGMTGQELESYAHETAARDTEDVAQPVRMGARSITEITMTNPLARMMWAYASEARQKISLFGWGFWSAKKDPVYFGKTAFLTFIVGGLMSQVLKNVWRELKGDDDEEKWSPARLAFSTAFGPLHGVPLVSQVVEGRGPLDSMKWTGSAVERLWEWDYDSPTDIMRDMDTILSAAGYFNDNAAGIAALSHLGVDFAKLLENAADAGE